jgi:hypothetical protein
MSTPFETLTILPDLAGNRFGQIQLGTDRVVTLRDEHTLLVEVVAALAGTDPSALTRDDVVHLQSRLRFHASFPKAERHRSMHQAISLLAGALMDGTDAQARAELARDAVLWTLAAARD